MKRIFLLVAFVLAAAVALASTAAAHPTNFRAHLSAPDGVDSTGQGQAKFQLSHNELSFIMPLSKLNGETLAAHIHYEGQGPVISLCGAFGPPPIPADDCGGPGHPAKGSVSLSDDQVDELMTNIAAGTAYVNVHTTAVGSGEVRGTVVASP